MPVISAFAPRAPASATEAVLLCHHYQRADVYQYADLTGDSLKLSRLASQTDARYIVFCGVHFMAEVADIMSKPEQIAILPDLAAGCSMADMANLAKVERCWRELGEVLDVDQQVTPVTYINSAADLKAFCGARGGIVCTSSNAGTIAAWAFARREKILFFPDQHLGRWTGFQMGIALDEMMVWDPDLEMGGLTAEQIRRARLLLWKGHCSVHQMFQPAHILRFSQPASRTAWSSPTRNAASKSAGSRISSARPSTSSDHQGSPARTRAGWSAPNSIWSTAWPKKSGPRARSCSSWRRRSACARRCSASTRSIWRGRSRIWPMATVVNQITVPRARAGTRQAGAGKNARCLLRSDPETCSTTT
jgi:quinolinate synthetase A subunit